MTIVPFPRHKRARCTSAHDDGGWMCAGCNLFTCETCGASEGELATHCPGYRLEPNERLAVFNGHLDFKDGQWVPSSKLATLTVNEIREQLWYSPKGPHVPLEGTSLTRGRHNPFWVLDLDEESSP